MKLAFLLLAVLALHGCSPRPATAESNKWEGWVYEAGELYKHYDAQYGVVCYTSTRGSSSRSPISCVKVTP